jgi:PIN domain nuclease of toxin-antitoxin system
MVLDTCALIWWTLDPEKLSLKASKAIESEAATISSMSIWEIGIKQKNGNLDLGMSLDLYVKTLKSTSIEIVDVNVETWLTNVKLNWKHKDPVDRTVVALARMRDQSLVTKDKKIRLFYKKSIW